MKLYNKLRSMVKKPYYYVPPCPVCGSMKTGRFLKMHSDYNNDWIKTQSLKNGEYVEFLPELPDEFNAFCLDCEALLVADIPMLMMTLDEIQEQKNLRETITVYTEHVLKTRDIKKEKENRRGFITNKIAKFVGHL